MPAHRTKHLARLGALAALVIALTAGHASAISGEWGFTRFAYSSEDCAYLVFLRNELDQVINHVEMQVQFFDAKGKSLGIYALAADTWIQPWTTEMIDWKVPEVCGSVDRAKIVKAVASY